MIKKRLATALLLLLACALAHGEAERGSMRQGAKKVSAQKTVQSKSASKQAKTVPQQAKPRKPAPAAKSAKKKPVPAQPVQADQPVLSQFRRLPYVGAIAADAETGRIIFADNAERKAYPASVTKLMTALLVLEDVEKGKYKLSDRAVASVRATYEQPSGVGIKPNQSMTIDDLLMALMVKSANDAAVVLAENSTGGDLLAFIARMNGRAAELGMKDTKYDSPNGLPPYDAKRRPKKWRHGYDHSTAADILKLALEVVKHKQIFKYTSTKIATVTDGSGKPLKAVNHNNILVKDKQKILNDKGESEVDGLKTGYIDAGGSSIALTGTRNGRRAIVVVLGSASTKDRDMNARSLMLRALKALEAQPVEKPAEKPAAHIAQSSAGVEAPPTAAQGGEPPNTAPGKPVAAGTPPAETAQPSSPGGGASLGWMLILSAFGVAAAAYFAWRWLGRNEREDWNFEDVPSEPPAAPPATA